MKAAPLHSFSKCLGSKRKGIPVYKKTSFQGCHVPMVDVCGGVYVFMCVRVSVCLGRKESMGEEEGQITLLTY